MKQMAVTFSGVLEKHTYIVWDALRESIKTLYAAEKAEEAKKADEAANSKTSTQKKKF